MVMTVVPKAVSVVSVSVVEEIVVVDSCLGVSVISLTKVVKTPSIYEVYVVLETISVVT